MADENVNDVGLLFLLDADPSGVQQGVSVAEATVARLRHQFGTDMKQLETVSIAAINGITEKLTDFTSHHLPLVGSLFNQIIGGIRGFGGQSAETSSQLGDLQESITSLATESGKSEGDISSFLGSLATIQSVALRADASTKFFGETLAEKLNPRAEKAAQQLNALATEAKSGAESLGSIINPTAIATFGLVALLGAITGVVGGLIHLAEKAAAYGEDIFKAHLKTKLSIESLSALKVAAEESGESLGSITRGFLKFNSVVDGARKGNEKFSEQLNKQGVTSFESSDKALVQFIDHFATLQTEEEQTNAVTAIFGARFGSKLVEVFHQVGGSLEEFKQELRDAGQLMSDEQVRAAHEATIAHHKLEEAFSALGRSIGVSVLPALASVTNALAANVKAALAVAAAIALIGVALIAVRFPQAITLVTSLGTSIKTLGLAAYQAAGGTLSLAAAEQAATVSTLALSAALAGVLIIAIAAVVLAYSQYTSAADDANAITQEQVEELKKAADEAAHLRHEVEELGKMQKGSAEEHEKLNEILKELDPQTRIYVEAVQDAEERIHRLTNRIIENKDANATSNQSRALAILTIRGLIEQYEAEEFAIATLKNRQDELNRSLQGRPVSGVMIGLKTATDRVKEAEDALKELQKQIPENEKKLRSLSDSANLNGQGFHQMALEAGAADAALDRLGKSYFNLRPLIDTSTEKLKEQAAAWERLRAALHGPIDQQTILNELTKAGVDLTGDQAKALEKFVNEQKTAVDETTRAIKEKQAKEEEAFKNGDIKASEFFNKQKENEKQLSVAKQAELEKRIDLAVKEQQRLAAIVAVKPEKTDQEAFARSIQEEKDLNQQLLDLRSGLNLKLAEIDYNAKQDELVRRKVHNDNLLEIQAADNRAFLAAQKELVTQGVLTQSQYEAQVALIGIKALEAQRDNLKKQLQDVGIFSKDYAAIKQQIALKVREINEAQLAEERRATAATYAEFQKRAGLILATGQVTLRQFQIFDQTRIEVLQAQAKHRIATEEDTERRILQIRLDANEREETFLKARLAAAGNIQDFEERLRVQKEINDQLKINKAERTAIEDAGNLAIDDARQRDLDNEKKYADELKAIEDKSIEDEEEIEQARISAMISNNVARATIIDAQAKLALDTQARIHANEQKAIDDERRLINIRIQQINTVLRTLNRKNADELRLAEALEKEKDNANLKIIALDKREEQEAERNRLRIKAIEDQKKKDKAANSPLGAGLDSLISGQLISIDRMIEAVKNLEGVATASMSAIFAGVNQLASGIGSLVQNWVLMGETGPAAFKKLVASTLASIAQQAATLAIMCLAYAALATTGIGAVLLGGSPEQFLIAAALFGAVAVGAALIGRAVAGDSFKPASTAGTGNPSGSTRPGDNTTNPAQVINMERNKIEVDVHIHTEPGFIGRSLVRDINSNNPQLTNAVKTAAGTK